MNQNGRLERRKAALPTQLGKYRIIAHLGQGGMADVFLAVVSGPGGFSKLHVLKRVRQEILDNEEAVAMLADEARVSALLNHPNVVQTHEVGYDRGHVFIVMEYLEGQSLQALLRQLNKTTPPTRLELGILLRIVSDVLNGLHHAHELRDFNGEPLRVVHRDVSPHNIFLTYDGSIKLVDFGVAKSASATAVTRIGTIKGRVSYMAPEQVVSPALVDRRADIFQVGLVLWEGIVGRRIWDGMNQSEILASLSRKGLPERAVPPAADPELMQIVLRAIAIDPNDRYPTAEALNRELEGYMVRRGIGVKARDVGGYVATVFDEQRAAVRDAVWRRLSQLQNEPSDVPTPVAAIPSFLPNIAPEPTSSSSDSIAPPISPPSSEPEFTPQERATSTNIPASRSIAPARNGSGSARLAVAVLVAMAAAGAVTTYVVRRGRIATIPTSNVMKYVDSAAAKPNEVHVSIQAVPPGARLFVDDAPVASNPFTARVRPDNATHRVRAEADGYQPAAITLRFDRDTKQVLELVPARPSAPPLGSGSDLAPSVVKAPKPPVARPRPPGPAASPANLRRSPSGVNLDPTDPWQ